MRTQALGDQRSPFSPLRGGRSSSQGREERVWDTAADGSWFQRDSTFHPVGDTVRPGTGMWQETKTRRAAAPAEMLAPLAHLPGREPKTTVPRLDWDLRPRAAGPGPGPRRHAPRFHLFAPCRGSLWSGRPRAGPACHLQDGPPTPAPSAWASQRELPQLGRASPRFSFPVAPSSRPGAAPPPVRPASTCWESGRSGAAIFPRTRAPSAGGMGRGSACALMRGRCARSCAGSGRGQASTHTRSRA